MEVKVEDEKEDGSIVLNVPGRRQRFAGKLQGTGFRFASGFGVFRARR